MTQTGATERAPARAPRGAARERVVRGAVTLFARHGVEGTSLQMIADELGVTKAAVYHQFKTKEDIVLAVVRPLFDEMAVFVEVAEREPTRPARRDLTLRGIVDLVVGHRELAAAFAGDPVILTVAREHEDLNELVTRVGLLLAGPDPSPAVRVAVSMVGAALGTGAADPELADIDDETLRRELLACARRLLEVPPGQ
jgi:AcrR family transcriptional regulator